MDLISNGGVGSAALDYVTGKEQELESLAGGSESSDESELAQKEEKKQEEELAGSYTTTARVS